MLDNGDLLVGIHLGPDTHQLPPGFQKIQELAKVAEIHGPPSRVNPNVAKA
jgi:hypothetical protein